MKITLETTESHRHRWISIGDNWDDHDINTVGEMLRTALLAWGFHPDKVKELFDDE